MRKFIFFLLFELTLRWVYDVFKKRKAKNKDSTCSKETSRSIVQKKRLAESGLANKKRASKKARSEGRTHA